MAIEDDYDGDMEEEVEMVMECPYCDGFGWQGVAGILLECPECGGEGWY